MSLINGTEVACIRPEQELMRRLTGMPLGALGGAGLGRVLGATDDEILHDPQTPADAEAYVVQPLGADGSENTGVDPDAAFIVVRHPEAQGSAPTPRGDLPVAIIARQISRAEFLASVARRIASEVEQAYSELDADLANLAASQDDDDEFFGRSSD